MTAYILLSVFFILACVGLGLLLAALFAVVMGCGDG